MVTWPPSARAPWTSSCTGAESAGPAGVAVPPEAVGNLPFRPVVLEGLTVQPRAEVSGQAKWITWVVRATGLRAVDTPSAGRGSAKSAGDGKAAA